MQVINNLQHNIKILNSFLSELAMNEEEITTYGLKRVTKWDSYLQVKPIINSFEIDLLDIIDISKYLDRDLYLKFDKLSNESKLIEDLTTISIQLLILEKKKNLSIGGDMLNTVFMQLPYISGVFKHRQLFYKEKISIQKILVSIKRLDTLLNRLRNIHEKAYTLDDEIFKPSNIDSDLLLGYLEQAITSLEENSAIPKADKSKIIEYVVSVKVEISKSKPNWNMIVGAMVIVAGLTGGIAAAPQAYENITNAINHVLGSSVEKHIPNLLLPPADAIESNIPSQTTVT